MALSLRGGRFRVTSLHSALYQHLQGCRLQYAPTSVCFPPSLHRYTLSLSQHTTMKTIATIVVLALVMSFACDVAGHKLL